MIYFLVAAVVVLRQRYRSLSLSLSLSLLWFIVASAIVLPLCRLLHRHCCSSPPSSSSIVVVVIIVALIASGISSLSPYYWQPLLALMSPLSRPLSSRVHSLGFALAASLSRPLSLVPSLASPLLSCTNSLWRPPLSLAKLRIMDVR